RRPAFLFGARSHGESSTRAAAWQVVGTGRLAARGRDPSSTRLSAGAACGGKGVFSGRTSSIGLVVGRGREGERRPVHAVALPGRFGSVREDVAEMGIAG